MRPSRTVVSAVAVLALGVSAFAASADAVPGRRNGWIYGNVVGSPVRDRVQLSYDAAADSCAVNVETGLDTGGYGPAVVHDYAIPGLRASNNCPNLGVVVHPPHAQVDDLVVAWFNGGYGPAYPLYVLRDFSVLTGSPAEFYPGHLGRQDFNGDGSSDIWESTDQFGNFDTYLRQGDGFVPGVSLVTSYSQYPSVAFGKLDNTPGTDIAVGYVSKDDQPGLPGSAGSGAVVIIGRTGQKILLEATPAGAHLPFAVTVTILDANGDGHNDVQVSGGPQPPRTYLGDGLGHFTLAP